MSFFNYYLSIIKIQSTWKSYKSSYNLKLLLISVISCVAFKISSSFLSIDELKSLFSVFDILKDADGESLAFSISSCFDAIS